MSFVDLPKDADVPVRYESLPKHIGRVGDLPYSLIVQKGFIFVRHLPVFAGYDPHFSC